MDEHVVGKHRAVVETAVSCQRAHPVDDFAKNRVIRRSLLQFMLPRLHNRSWNTPSGEIPSDINGEPKYLTELTVRAVVRFAAEKHNALSKWLIYPDLQERKEIKDYENIRPMRTPSSFCSWPR